MSAASLSARPASAFFRPSVQSFVRASRACRSASAFLGHRASSFSFTAFEGSSSVAAARATCISDDIVGALRQILVEDERPHLVPLERIVESLDALIPTATEGRQIEDRTRVPFGIGPDAGNFSRDERRLTGQF